MSDVYAKLWESLEQLPRLKLIAATTPLLPLQKMSRELGVTLWCKRDDLINFGLGGNKIRGLELLAADALNKQADVLVTGAGVQSNHVRATAAVAAYIDMRCDAVFWGDRPEHIDGNYRVTQMLGAESIFTGDAERASVDQGISEHCTLLLKQGLHPYSIPRGGACALGALGHALAARELYRQCRELNIVPDKIILATGSGGTHAGWLLGTRALGNPWIIESVTVSREITEARTEITRLANAAAAYLDIDWHFLTNQVIVHGGFIGSGYGVPSAEGTAAICQLGRSEGLLLDPTYTGKAMACLLALVRNGSISDETVVFIHSGGEPAFFAGTCEWLTL